jgi:acyl-CoA thioesterase FadM
MEETEHAFLRHAGVPMFRLESDGAKITWPRVRALCSFVVPARYDDILEIDLNVARIGEKSLTYEIRFRRGETLLATGELTTVCCRFRHDLPLESIPIPDEYRVILARMTS